MAAFEYYQLAVSNCQELYFGVNTFEDILDGRTDYKNLTYLNVTLTGKVLRWKLYFQDEDFHLYHVPGKKVHQFLKFYALLRLCENNLPARLDHADPSA